LISLGQEKLVSKNYEVLRQAGKALELFRSHAPERGGGDARPSIQNGDRRIREEILKLVQRTFFSCAPDGPRVVTFTGIEQGNGCSWVCARAAEALAAHVEDTVCVVEGNLQTTSLHRYFGVSRGGFLANPGIHDGSIQSLARPIRGTNLWLMSRWALPSDTPAAMTCKRLEARFRELCSHFKYVLVDAPPVNECGESLMFARLADGVVLVIEAHSTRREAARRAKESLESANVKLLGAVLNKRTFPIPEAVYTKI
jgi:Mrp family chromosome partitioning ATPase